MVVVDLKDQHAPPAFLRHPGSHRGLHVSAVNKLAVARIAGWRCALVASNDSGPLLVKFGDTRGHREHKTRRNGYQSTPPQYNL